MADKIDVFLLAAGEATRMFPISTFMEKSLLPIAGKPVCRHIVDELYKRDDIGKIMICCLDKYRKQFEHEFRDLDLAITSFPKPVGTFTTFYRVSKYADISDWVLIRYADCLTDIDWNYYLNIQRLSNCDDVECNACCDGIIAVTHNVKHDYSEVRIDDNEAYNVEPRTVKAFFEKPYISHFTWSGIGLFHTKHIRLDYIIKRQNTDFAFDIFPQMVRRNRLKAYCYSRNWFDVGNLNNYRKVCEIYEGKNK